MQGRDACETLAMLHQKHRESRLDMTVIQGLEGNDEEAKGCFSTCESFFSLIFFRQRF